MINKAHLFLSAAAVMALGAPVAAQTAAVTTTTTTAVAPTVDGGVVYESHSVTGPAGAHVVAPVGTTTVVTTPNTVVAPVTANHRPLVFYYYDAKAGQIVAASTMTEDIFRIWDRDGNGNISPQEYYYNAMVMYEPVETRTKVFADIDADGRLELTQNEYTMRLQQLPGYTTLNTDSKAGISVHEFVGAGFQRTDDNDDNQVSYDELVEQFYDQPAMASEQERYN